jgi:hypothetical protein
MIEFLPSFRDLRSVVSAASVRHKSEQAFRPWLEVCEFGHRNRLLFQTAVRVKNNKHAWIRKILRQTTSLTGIVITIAGYRHSADCLKKLHWQLKKRDKRKPVDAC